MKKNLTIVVEETSTGLSCYAKEIDGLIAVGETLQELKSNFNEALSYEVEYLNEQNKAELNVKDFVLNYTSPSLSV